jgi:hypothetical protein
VRGTLAQRDLSDVDYTYLWANIRLEEYKICLLAMIGVRHDGRKELVALADGYRESIESWADLLRDAARRGMHAPMSAIGDGALGFRGALREVFPETQEQRYWFHKIGTVLSALPKTAHPGAKKALPEICNARTNGTPWRQSRPLTPPTARSFPKPPARSPTTSTNYWRSSTTRPSTESTRAPPTRSSPLSSPSATAPRSPGAPAPARPDSPWRSHSSSPHKPAGARGERTPHRRSRPPQCMLRQRPNFVGVDGWRRSWLG